MATHKPTQPVKHYETWLEELMALLDWYPNMPNDAKFCLHCFCLWWLFGLAVLLLVPAMRRYIARPMTPVGSSGWYRYSIVVPAFWLTAWFWPIVVLHKIFDPNPEGSENDYARRRLVRGPADEERPLLWGCRGRWEDDGAHDGDDEWEDVDDDDDDEEEEDDDDDDHARGRLGGWAYVWWEATRHSRAG